MLCARGVPFTDAQVSANLVHGKEFSLIDAKKGSGVGGKVTCITRNLHPLVQLRRQICVGFLGGGASLFFFIGFCSRLS